MSPISMYRDFSYSYGPYRSSEPSYRKVTLADALRLVVRGEMQALSVFNQSPEGFQKILNDLCRDSLGKEFKHLTSDEQKNVFSMLLIALDNTEENIKAKTSATVVPPVTTLPKNLTPPLHNKRWWQFWR